MNPGSVLYKLEALWIVAFCDWSCVSVRPSDLCVFGVTWSNLLCALTDPFNRFVVPKITHKMHLLYSSAIGKVCLHFVPHLFMLHPAKFKWRTQSSNSLVLFYNRSFCLFWQKQLAALSLRGLRQLKTTACLSSNIPMSRFDGEPVPYEKLNTNLKIVRDR